MNFKENHQYLGNNLLINVYGILNKCSMVVVLFK